ncbi:hypothetical protein [Rhodopseudomonas palustris]|uniref:hypothetical protein n=1 Tax=Rhodopseudomonas palustris TaxID=1076 RepID=UPI000641DAF0|nr:hypothetical protein [Rhodopseudomonas palustris]
MPMDNSNFPFVWMSYTDAPGHDHDEDFASFEENLKRGEPFVVLTDSAPSEDHEHSQAERKRTSLWMKKHKAELRKLVLAMIIVEPSAAKRLAFKAFGITFQKFWGYPMLLASSRDEAMAIGRKLLSDRAGPSAA